MGSRPVSRVLSRTVIHLGCASPRTSSGLPGNSAGRAIVPLFGLAPGGVCPATTVASRAVRSYRTISPLPLAGRYSFCGTFRRLAPPRRYLALCPVEPGLSSPALRQQRPSGRLRRGDYAGVRPDTRTRQTEISPSDRARAHTAHFS